MELSTILILGALSGLIQILGYIYYIQKFKKNDISPNPTTWLIFAGDTTLLTILETFAGASTPLLILPVTCTIGCLYIAWLLRKCGRLSWPADRSDRQVLIVSVFIGLAYTYFFFLWQYNIVPFELLLQISIAFLILNNLNTFIAFIPITKEIYKMPEHEHAGPWAVWTLAYVLLGVATYLEVGFNLKNSVLYLYPVICAILHGTIAVLAIDRGKLQIFAR